MFAKFIDIDRLIHSVKTAITCAIAVLITKIIGFQADQWVVITVIVVMCAQIYVGSVLQRAYLRFLGTLTGCLFAAIAIVVAGNNVSLAVITITIALSGFVFSYLATSQENMSYTGTLGAVTTIIILMQDHTSLYVAETRFLEISFGILLATLVSQFVFPIHARTHLRHTQADTLKQLRDYYTAIMISHTIETETSQSDFDEAIVKSISKQRQLAKEAGREPLGVFYDPKLFMESLHCEREILRSINYMYYALSHIKNIENAISQLPTLQTFNTIVVQALNIVINTVKTDELPKKPAELPSLNALRDDIQKTIPAPSRTDLMYIDGFLFSAEILINSLATIMKSYRIPLVI